jgi:hypothetical protein
MAVFDCGSEMNEFHESEVRLPTTVQKELKARRDAGRTRLKKGLERDGHPAPDNFSQGSYRMFTMVQADGGDYDIDDGAYFWHEDLQDGNGAPLTSEAAKTRVCDALVQDERLKEPASIHDNCVRQTYPAGYHIDIPVYRVIVAGADEDDKEAYELATSKGWKKSDARAVTKWFAQAVTDQNVDENQSGRQMRRVVRLTKAFARSDGSWKESMTSGIVLTRLVVDEFVKSPNRDDYSLLETWKKIESRVAKTTEVAHPVNADNLADAGNAGVKFFQGRLATALATLAKLETGCTRNEARKAWDDVFNTSFFSKQPDPNSNDGGGASKSAVVITASKSDRREDDGERYGTTC